MIIVYTGEEPPAQFSKSIFLAGPTPRSAEVESWRPLALELLSEKDYDGVVFVPEDRVFTPKRVYEDQVGWEHRMLNMSDCILFWVPRDLEKLPGFTTNVEFGLFAKSGRVIFGAPFRAPKNNYLKYCAEKLHVPLADDLEGIVDLAIEKTREGAPRQEGEREVPLFIWHSRPFQAWHEAQKSAGNRLAGVRLEWISRVRQKPDKVFCFAIHPSVYVASEDRVKLNEPIIFRLDISAIILYKKQSIFLETEIVLIKEFRSANCTNDGFIWELPGGSSPFLTNQTEVAVEEVHEEVGLKIDKARFREHGARQLAGTLLTHKSHLFSVELTGEEMRYVLSQKGIPHGADLDNPTGERAYIEVRTVQEILENNLLDWSNVGMILQGIREIYKTPM